MAQSRIEGDFYFAGNILIANLTALEMALRGATITDANIVPGAGIESSKVQQQHSEKYSQAVGTTPVTETKVIHEVYGATCTILALRVGTVTVLTGAATITVDVKKNGTTILSSVVTLNSSNVAYTPVAGTITVPGGVAGDVYTIVVVATAGGGGLGGGVYANLILNEDPQ